MTRRLSALLATLVSLALVGCGRVPEQSLRDEQARSRKYRDAYETGLQETEWLKKRLAETEQRAAACTATTPPSDPQHPVLRRPEKGDSPPILPPKTPPPTE